ncbi:MAG: L-rhamnose/proton symporter RhaT [Paludibaculum sp.]
MTGWLLVLAAGLCQGGFMAPMKLMRGWKWENGWLIFACTAYLVCPWLFVSLTAPNVWQIYRAAGEERIALVVSMGLLWGLGALTFGLGVDALGLSIGFAVILGVAATSGTLVPLLILNEAAPRGEVLALTLLSLVLMLGGVAVCSLAGGWRESAEGKRTYTRGVTLCVLSGLLSSCGNIGLVLGKPIIDLAVASGVSPDFAPNVVWSLLTISLFLCNAGYTGFKLRRERSAALFRISGSGRNLLLGVLMGVLWMLGFVFYGAGTRQLGSLGPSFGWSVLMGSMVMTANILGFVSGEWKGAPTSALRRLWIGVGLLCLAIVGLGVSNRMAA